MRWSQIEGEEHYGKTGEFFIERWFDSINYFLTPYLGEFLSSILTSGIIIVIFGIIIVAIFSIVNFILDY